MNTMLMAFNRAGVTSTEQKQRAAAKARRKRDAAAYRATQSRDSAGRFRSVQADRAEVAAYGALERTLRQG